MDLNELTIWFMLMIFHLKLQILTAALKFTFGSWFRFKPLLSGAVFRIRWHEIAYSKPKRLQQSELGGSTPTCNQIPVAVLALGTRGEKSNSVIEVAPVGFRDPLLGGIHLIQPLHVPQGSGVRLEPGGPAFPALTSLVGQHFEQGGQEGITSAHAVGQPQQRVELAELRSSRGPGEFVRSCTIPGAGGALDATRKPVKAAIETNADPPGTRHALQSRSLTTPPPKTFKKKTPRARALLYVSAV